MMIVLGWLPAMPVQAHPHIFVRYDVTIAKSDPGYIKLHFKFAIHDIANPLLSPDAKIGDVPLLKKDMLANIAEHPFFLYLDINGKDMRQQVVELVSSQANGDDQTFTFDLVLPDGMKSFGFSLYDPTYFDTVWQNSTDSTDNKLTNMRCSVEVQDIGKTVWGMLQAQHIACSDGSEASPVIHRPNISPLQAPTKDLQDFGTSKSVLP